MPANIIEPFAKKSGKTVKEVEKLWHEAEKLAKKAKPKPDDVYAYAVGILKKMLKLNESSNSFKEFLIDQQIDKQLKDIDDSE